MILIALNLAKIPKQRFSNKNHNYEYAGVLHSINKDNALNLKNFQKNLKIELIEKTQTDARIRVRGIEAPMANAIRRILISEIDTMAVDKVVIY